MKTTQKAGTITKLTSQLVEENTAREITTITPFLLSHSWDSIGVLQSYDFNLQEIHVGNKEGFLSHQHKIKCHLLNQM